MSVIADHWFDVVVVAFIGLGLYKGGRSVALPQVLSFAHWGLTLVLCSFSILYEWPAVQLSKLVHWQPDVLALMIFPVEFLIVFIVLSLVRKRIAGDAGESDRQETFGNWEHQIAKAAGVARWLVMLLILMSWLHGRFVGPDDVQKYKAFCDEYFSGIRFPALCTMQDEVFNRSYSGRFAQAYLGKILMTAIPRFDYGESGSVEITGKGTTKLKEVSEFGPEGNEGELREGKERSPKQKDGPEGKEVAAQPSPAASGKTATPAAKPAPRAIETVYHALTLKGISGSGNNLLALINNKSFNEGESGIIKVDKGKLKITCVKILEKSAMIQVEGSKDVIELKMGVTTDQKGKVLPDQ